MDAAVRELSYAQAIQEAMAIAMEADERVFLMGEDIGIYGGAFQVTGDLVHRFGEDRVMDTPISELGGAGVAVGAALTGLRPIFEFQFSDFATLAMEQIVNQAAKMRYMLGGAVSVPLVMRFPAGSGTGAAAQHSQSLEAWFAHVPGLKVIEPATPHDAKGLLLAAIADPDPVMIFEHKLLYKMKGPVPEGHYIVPIGSAEVRRQGRDLTIVASAIMVHKALDAAATLAEEGIEAEVIDLRSLRPIDWPDADPQRQEDRSAALRLRRRESPRDRGGDQRRHRGERGLRLPRRTDPPARGRRLPDPLQPGPREGRGAPGGGYSRGVAQTRPAQDLTMPTEVILPRVDMDMTTGKIARWYVEEGQRIEKGKPLFEIETDKAAMEIEAPVSGIVRDIAAATGQDMPVGQAVAWIFAADEPYRPHAAGAPAATRASSEPVAAPSLQALAPEQPESAPADPLPRATPLARRLARESGVDLAAAAGSGPRGRIQSGDILALVDARRTAPVPASADPAPVRAAADRPEPDGRRLRHVWLAPRHRAAGADDPWLRLGARQLAAAALRPRPRPAGPRHRPAGPRRLAARRHQRVRGARRRGRRSGVGVWA